jgi:ADP-ribose pyrophosphatase
LPTETEKKIQTIATLKAASFSVHLDDVLLRDGKATRRIRIAHPEAAAVLPFVSEGEILMVRQYRYALGRETLEIPAGKLDPGETPEQCAARELLEETGYGAESLGRVYTFAPALGYSNELIHIFSAYGLKKVKTEIDEAEISAVERLGVDRVLSLIREGRILDAKTLIGLAMVVGLPGR